MKKIFLLLIFLFPALFAGAQSFELLNGDTINKVDAMGKKQGFWVIFNKEKKLPCYQPTQKVEEGKFKSSRKEGLWKTYFCNGKVKNKINYQNNRPNGYAIIYHENGKVYEEGEWRNNRWVGEYKLYYENGQVAQAFNFNTMGKREGEQKYYYENGQVMIEGNWLSGKEDGVLKEFYENGDLKAEKHFNGGDINPDLTKTYKPKQAVQKKEAPAIAQGVKVKEEEKANLEVFNGEGYWKLYNQNRRISKDGIFSKGRLVNGKVYHYSKDGILKRIAIYKDGAYVGDGVIEDEDI